MKSWLVVQNLRIALSRVFEGNEHSTQRNYINAKFDKLIQNLIS